MSYGTGMLQGMAVTAKNFVQSYYDKDRLTTIQYPEQKELPKENFRNIPFLVFDKDPDAGIRCVACKICEVECPPQCIYIEIDRDEKGKPLRRPKVFDIDMTVCMNCGICAEVCPFEAIKMDSQYELSSYDRFHDQLATKARLLKSNEYFHKIKPTQALASDAKMKAEEDKKKKKAAPKPAAAVAVAAAQAKFFLPPDAPLNDEQKAWVEKYMAEKGSAATATATAEAPVEAGEPWHDQTLGLSERMKFAASRPLEDKLMAAMAQLDCQACGYNCRDYSMAIFKGEDPDITKCVPGEGETREALKKLLQEAGRPVEA